MGNPGESMAISVHRYGPQIGEVDGRSYNPPATTSATGVKIRSRSSA